MFSKNEISSQMCLTINSSKWTKVKTTENYLKISNYSLSKVIYEAYVS